MNASSSLSRETLHRLLGAPPRAVLYDLDGVLIDSMMAWFHVIQRGLRELGRPPTTLDYFRGTFGQGVEADRAEFFPEWTSAELNAFYARALVDELESIEVVPRASEVLQQIGALGLRQAVVTNTPLPLATRVLSCKGLAPYLDVIAAAGEAEEKPAPDLLLLALSRLGSRAEETIYVGDSATDAAAAEAAGVLLVGMRQPGAVTLSSLSELLALI